jgi:hypothetical protein
MEQDGVDIETISFVINTHSHPDHFDGTVNFTKYGIPAGMHKEEIKFLNETGPLFYQMMGMQFPEINFEIEMEEGFLDIGEHKLEVYKTPGHSPASACIYWREKKVLVCGDLIFNNSFGRFDFPAATRNSLKRVSREYPSLISNTCSPVIWTLLPGKRMCRKTLRLFSSILIYFKIYIQKGVATPFCKHYGTYLFTSGILLPIPKAFDVTFSPGAAWNLLYSFILMSLST